MYLDWPLLRVQRSRDECLTIAARYPQLTLPLGASAIPHDRGYRGARESSDGVDSTIFGMQMTYTYTGLLPVPDTGNTLLSTAVLKPTTSQQSCRRTIHMRD